MVQEGLEPPRLSDLVYSQASQPIAQLHLGVDSGIRTHTVHVLNVFPLPLGYVDMMSRAAPYVWINSESRPESPEELLMVAHPRFELGSYTGFEAAAYASSASEPW